MIRVPLSQVKRKLDKVGCGFCLAKWTQVTMHLGSGLTQSCHHVGAHKIDLLELQNNPSALHNTTFKKDRRKEMLNGERPGECDYCWRVEDNTDQYSDRILKSKDAYSWPHFDTIKNLTGDENFYPTYVEISFSNVCNFKCGYCGPAFSSKWTEEIKQLGPISFPTSNWTYNDIDPNEVQILERERNPYIEAFWKWFPEAVTHMHTLRITGGEPLLSKNTFKVIDHLLEHPQPQLEFSINTNACPPGDLWKTFVEKINLLIENKCIKKFILFTSAEGKGAQQEYNRDGMDWSMFITNISYYLKNTKQEVSFMCAFNILSFPTFLPFIKWVVRISRKHLYRVYLDIPYVRNPGFLDARIATLDMIEEYLDPIQQFLTQEKAELAKVDHYNGTNLDRPLIQITRIIQDLKKAQLEPIEPIINSNRGMFHHWINTYDKRRDKNFKETFPELTEFYEWCKDV